jgi:hypothetical protein
MRAKQEKRCRTAARCGPTTPRSEVEITLSSMERACA